MGRGDPDDGPASRGVNREFSLELEDVFAHLANETQAEARAKAEAEATASPGKKKPPVPNHSKSDSTKEETAKCSSSELLDAPVALRKSAAPAARRMKRRPVPQQQQQRNHQSASTTAGLLNFLSYKNTTSSTGNISSNSDDFSRADMFLESLRKKEQDNLQLNNGSSEKRDEEGDSEKFKKLSERNKRREQMRDRMRRERIQQNQVLERAQRRTKSPSKRENGVAPNNISKDETLSPQKLGSSGPARIMLRQPSQKELDLSLRKEGRATKSFGLDLLQPQQQSKENASTSDIDFVSSDGEEDETEDDGTVLQFDPSQTDNVFMVKQVHNSESECEISNNGSQSLINISGLEDPMSMAQQQEQISTNKNQPIFDFLDDTQTNSTKASTRKAVPRPQSPKKKAPAQNGVRPDGKRKPLHKTQSSSIIVDDAQNYSQFFQSDGNMEDSFNRHPRHQGSFTDNNSSWPPSARGAQGNIPDNKGKLKKRIPPNKNVGKQTKPGISRNNSGRGKPPPGIGSPKRRPQKPQSATGSEKQGIKSPSLQNTPMRKQLKQPMTGSQKHALKSPSLRDTPTQQNSFEKLGELLPFDKELESPLYAGEASVINPPSVGSSQISLDPPSDKSGRSASSSVDITSTAGDTNSSALSQSFAESASGSATLSHVIESSKAWETDADEDNAQTRRGGHRISAALATSIGRYFVGKGRKGAEVSELDDDEDSGSVASRSVFSRTGLGQGKRGHQLLADDSSNENSFHSRNQ